MMMNKLPIPADHDDGSGRPRADLAPAIRTAADAEPGSGVTLLEVEAEGRTWLVKHNRGVLGRVADKDEAIQLASGLAAWCRSQGRLVSFQAD